MVDAFSGRDRLQGLLMAGHHRAADLPVISISDRVDQPFHFCHGGVHINGRSGIPVSLDKEEYMELNTEPEEPDSAENENISETPEHAIHTGDIVQHFKREWVSPDTSEYLYKVLAVAHHTENGEKLMIYQALYAPFKICARPYDMFMSEVDREKYPDIKQKYRFEKYTEK